MRGNTQAARSRPSKEESALTNRGDRDNWFASIVACITIGAIAGAVIGTALFFALDPAYLPVGMAVGAGVGASVWFALNDRGGG